jgi:hypothetical protein
VATLLATFALGAALGGRRVGLLAAVLAATPRVWLFRGSCRATDDDVPRRRVRRRGADARGARRARPAARARVRRGGVLAKGP